MSANDVHLRIKEVKKELYDANDIMNEKYAKLFTTCQELTNKVSFVHNLNKTFEKMREAVEKSHHKVM